ncbi:MAG TPA: MFS transporter [Steroidobacteraceae bacterium]|nr:MFS transporter [Steroidobacteraceae bacterium]
MTIPVRYRLVGLLFSGSAVNYIDRVNIAIAAPAMMAATGLRKDQFGLVFSIFLLGYAVMQIPAGILADRRSPRVLLMGCFAGFSLFTALTPLAASAAMSLLLARFLLGVFEGPTFPAITAFNSRLFPPTELGRAQTLSLAGGSFGQMLAYPLSAWVLLQFSWQAVFYVSALLGVAWLAVWSFSSRHGPRERAGADAGEPGPPTVGRSVDVSHDLPLAFMFAPPVLMLAAAAMFFALVLWTFIFWFPTYLIEARGFTLAEVGAIGMAIQGCGFLGTATSGLISDAILLRTGKPRLARTAYAGACVALASIFLCGAVLVSSRAACVVLWGLCYFLLQSVNVAFLAAPAVLHPRRAASLYGVINCAASIGAMCGPTLAGFLMTDSTNWSRAFAIVAAFGVISALALFAIRLARLEKPPAGERGDAICM